MSSQERDDQRELTRLRANAEARDAEIARLHAQADSDREEIAQLRADAAMRNAILRRAQEDLASAELELDDLRAVRDALAPAALPERPGLVLDATYEAATRRVSGDFYLAADGPDDSTVLVVGDVAGKGIEAARRAIFVRATFAAGAAYSSDPCLLLRWANAALQGRELFADRFATAVCATYSPVTRTLRWALAGHPPPLRIRTGEELGAPASPPLGIQEDLSCVHQELELERGDGVLLYTDGLIEARRDGELFGIQRAARTVRATTGRPAGELLARLQAEVVAYGGEVLSDDLCLLDARVA